MKSVMEGIGRFRLSNNHCRALLPKYGIYICVIFQVLFGLGGLPLMVDATCHFKNKNQTAANQIYKRLAPIDQKKFFVNDAINKYHYTIGICTPVSDLPSEDDFGVTQIEVDRNRKPVKNTILVGRLSNVQIVAGTNWVLLKYPDGLHYNNNPCNGTSRQASIMIICDEKASSVNPQLQVIEEDRGKLSDCYYLFELSHKCVCQKNRAVGLGTGSIISIVFLSGVFAYLFGGFLYMRFVLGAKGYEQIPNCGFWQDFGNLLSDGCNLVCRSGNRGQPKTYKGIGDDQLQDEDERDEHLLPM